MAYEAATSRGIKKEDLAKCNQQLKTLTEIIQLFETTYNHEIKSDYYVMKKINGEHSAYAGLAGVVIGFLTGIAFPPLALPALATIAGSLGVFVTSASQHGSYYKIKNKQKWKEETEYMFSVLRIKKCSKKSRQRDS